MTGRSGCAMTSRTPSTWCARGSLVRPSVSFWRMIPIRPPTPRHSTHRFPSTFFAPLHVLHLMPLTSRLVKPEMSWTSRLETSVRWMASTSVSTAFAGAARRRESMRASDSGRLPGPRFHPRFTWRHAVGADANTGAGPATASNSASHCDTRLKASGRARSACPSFAMRPKSRRNLALAASRAAAAYRSSRSVPAAPGTGVVAGVPKGAASASSLFGASVFSSDSME